MFKMRFSGLFIRRTFTSLEWLAQRKYQGRKHSQPTSGWISHWDGCTCFSAVTTNTKSQAEIFPGKHTSLCHLVWSKLLRLPKSRDSSHCFSPASHQPSSAHGPGHAHGNFGFWVPKEFRFPKFIPPGILGPVLGTSVQEENKKSQGLEQEALWGQAEGREGKAGWEKQTVNTKDCEQTSALLFDGESILHPAGGYKFLHF